MKALKIFSSLVFTIFTLASCTRSDTLIGKYQFEDNDSLIGFEFFEDNKMIYHVAGEVGIVADYELIEEAGKQSITISERKYNHDQTFNISIDDDTFVLTSGDGYGQDNRVFQKVDEFSFPETTDLLLRSNRSRARILLGSLMRAQQAYYVEYGQFVDTFEDLDAGEISDNFYYDYSMILLSNFNQGIIVLAEAKSGGLNSFIGIVASDNSNLPSILCEANEPFTPLPKSVNLRNGLVCPPGFSDTGF